MSDTNFNSCFVDARIDGGTLKFVKGDSSTYSLPITDLQNRTAINSVHFNQNTMVFTFASQDGSVKTIQLPVYPEYNDFDEVELIGSVLTFYSNGSASGSVNLSSLISESVGNPIVDVDVDTTDTNNKKLVFTTASGSKQQVNVSNLLNKNVLKNVAFNTSDKKLIFAQDDGDVTTIDLSSLVDLTDVKYDDSKFILKFYNKNSEYLTIDLSSINNSTSLSRETNLRISGDTALSNNIINESLIRISGDTLLSDSIEIEKNARILADESLTSAIHSINMSGATILSTDLSNEKVIRSLADATISTAISLETTNRLSTDIILSTNISTDITNLSTETSTRIDEVSSRISIDNTLSSTISTEIIGRISGDTSLTSRISTEEYLRLSIDFSVSTKISNDYDIRLSNDTSLSTTLSTEISSRISIDTSTSLKQSTESSTRSSADLTLFYSVSTETSNRTSVDNSLSTKISTDISLKTSTDTVLSTTLSTESSLRITGDTSLSNSLLNENSTRISSDNLLSTNISTETILRITGDSSLSNKISTETYLRTSTDSVLSTTVSSEISNRSILTTSLSTSMSNRISVENSISSTVSSIQGVTMKWKGVFIDSTGLTTAYPSPIVGDYAWVGASQATLVVYRCNTNGIWTATTDNPSQQELNLLNYYTKTEVDNLKVGKSGNENIDGVKTFLQSPLIPSGVTNNLNPATKQYVDAADAQISADLNQISGTDFSISGFVNTNGTFGVDNTRRRTDYIIISTLKNISFLSESSNQYVNAISFYDIDKKYLSGISNNQATPSLQVILAANIPINACYAILSTTTELLSISFCKYGGLQSVIQTVYDIIKSRIMIIDDSKLDKSIGKNFFNKDSSGIIDSQYMISNGTIFNNTLYFVSDYIPVLPNTTYVHKNFSMGSAYSCIYDENKKYISSFQTDTITTPSNCYYVRMSGLIANKATQQFELGSIATAYESYTEFVTLDNAIRTVHEYINSINLTNKLDKQIGKNLLNPYDQDVIIGKFLQGSQLATHASYSISGYINVSGLSNVTINFSLLGAYVAFYDIDKKYISAFSSGNTFAVPTNAIYLRVSGPNIVQTDWQVESGTVQTSFEDYTDYTPLGYVKTQVPNRDVSIILPDKMYFVKGKQSCIYYENILFKNLSDPTTLFFSNGTNYNRQVTFNFPADGTNQILNAQVIRSFKKGKLKAITYDIIDPSVNNGKIVNAVHIGDSFTDMGYWVKEVKKIMEDQGVTYNLLGTCGDSTFKAEGFSGGTLANTFLNTSSGVGRKVQVTGVTVLPSTYYPGRTYRDLNGTDWIIRSGKIDADGNGHIVVTKNGAIESDFTNFPSSGSLTKITSGEGDEIINYSNPTFCYFNPFINPSTGLLDITNYITTWSFSTPDLFLFQFTWNDVGTWALDATISSLVSQFKITADHVHSAYPNAKVVFSIEPCGSINGNKDWNGKKYSILRFAELMLSQFEDDINYNWVKIAPSYAFVDLVNGYSSSIVTPCERYNTINEVSVGDGIHPFTGMLQIADCISQIVSAII